MSEPGSDRSTPWGQLDVSGGLADPVREALGRFERVAGWVPRRLEAELALDRRPLSILRVDGPSRRTAQFFVEPERRIELYGAALDGLSGRFAPERYLRAALLHEFAHVWDEASQFVLSSGLLATTGGVWREPVYVAGPRGASEPVTTRSGHVDPYEDLAESVAYVLLGDRYLDGKHGIVDRVRHGYVHDLFAAPQSREKALEALRDRTPKPTQDGATYAGP